jgi:hypothetical protein
MTCEDPTIRRMPGRPSDELAGLARRPRIRERRWRCRPVVPEGRVQRRLVEALAYSAVVTTTTTTTGIYWRPGCSAKPLAKNTRTFELATAAEAVGFRNQPTAIGLPTADAGYSLRQST